MAAASPDSTTLRRLTVGDASACEELALEHGWQVGAERWRLMLGVGEGWGSFVPGEGLVGTTLRFCYEGRVALVAMVLVRKAFGRQGIAGRLVAQALTGAPEATYLYATAQGRGLYERMGFVAQGSISRFSGVARPTPNSGASEIRALERADLRAATSLDAEALGAARPEVLAALHGCAVRALGAWRGEQLVGYGLSTRVGHHVAIGPVIALDEAIGVRLVAALAEAQPQPVQLDAPTGRALVRDWAVAAGLTEEASLPLMALGDRALPGRRERIVAIASRGLG